MTLFRLARVLLVVALGLSAFALAGCPGPEYPNCESDDHCKKDKGGKALNQHCLFGKCQECAKDTHCGVGSKCNAGRCEKTCSSDEQCGDGTICEGSVCKPAECSSDAACGSGASCAQGRCKREAPVAAAPSQTGQACESKARVLFDFNVSDLRGDSRTALDDFARCMKTNAGWKLTIEGHADERGTPEYNLSLGEARAKSVKKYLVNLGVEDARVKVVSYGEEKPLDSSATEDAWAKNRRSELTAQ